MDGFEPDTMMEASMNTSDAEETQEEEEDLQELEEEEEVLDEVRFHYRNTIRNLV